MAQGWEKLEPQFEPDGSLRDVLVLDIGIEEWQRAWDALKGWNPAPNLMIDGIPAPCPDDVCGLLGRSEDLPLLVIDIEGCTVHCHFYDQCEIEFDLDPREFVTDVQVGRFFEFLATLYRAIGKELVVTLDGCSDIVILNFPAR